MAHLIKSKSELEGIYNVLTLIKSSGFRNSKCLELSNCLLTVRYSEEKFRKFLAYKRNFINIIGKTAILSCKRADRVYNESLDRMTKPNYFKRMFAFEEINRENKVVINQIDTIIEELAKKPHHSILTFTIFRPIDLINKKRPGYVPCPISGDFKFRQGELQLNIFFRSNDALNFLYPDIYYLRKLQKKVLMEAQNITTHKVLKNGAVGSLNLHFSRVFLPLRMEIRRKEYINKADLDIKIGNLITSLSKKIES